MTEKFKHELNIIKTKPLIDANKALNSLHFEYTILPTETDPHKADVLNYGVYGKIFSEKTEAKLVKTWMDGERIWIACSQQHKVTITRELLLSLVNHEVVVKVWDTRDKLIPKTKYDKPKNFKAPTVKPGETFEDSGPMKGLVIRHVKSHLKAFSKKTSQRPFPSAVVDALGPRGRASAAESPPAGRFPVASSTGSRDNTAIAAETRAKREPDVQCESSVNTASRVTIAPPTASTDAPSAAKKAAKKVTTTSSKQSTLQVPSQHEGAEFKGSAANLHSSSEDSRSPSQAQSSLSRAALAKKRPEYENGLFQIRVAMARFFAGSKVSSGRMLNPIKDIEECLVTISLNGSLMSESLQEELNPMVITLQGVVDLPQTPQSYQELEDRCKPVYCEYQFFQQENHRTHGKRHDKCIFFDDVNVVFAGILGPDELKSYLAGPPLEVEVHDRDMNPARMPADSNALFGSEPDDKHLSSVSFVANKRTIHNAFRYRNDLWNPHGIGYCSMAELLYGKTFLHLRIPVLPCPIPDILTGILKEGIPPKGVMSLPGAIDRPIVPPLPMGKYLEAQTELKLTVKLSRPLAVMKQDPATPPTEACPFARMIVIIDHNNLDLHHQLLRTIWCLNAFALGLDEMPQDILNSVLSTYKLDSQQQRDKHLDIVTGSQVVDGEVHIFIIEGLHRGSIPRIWNEFFTKQDENPNDIRILYDSSLSFPNRLYAALDVDLLRIRLQMPLRLITGNALLFVRDMVPRKCFQALIKLLALAQTARLRDAFRNDLFPSAEMMIALGREFGMPLTQADVEHFGLSRGKEKADFFPTQSEPTDTPFEADDVPLAQQDVVEEEPSLESKAAPLPVNYLRQNIDIVHEKSKKNKKSKEKRIFISDEAVFNYSTQKLNSAGLALEQLRERLSQNPDVRYTFSEGYHQSGTMAPANVDKVEMEERKRETEKWVAEVNWIYPGMKSATADNAPPVKLPDNRLQELREPWSCSALFNNTTKPTLNRQAYPWPRRHADLDIWRQPQPEHRSVGAQTVFPAGDTKKLEEKLVKQEDHVSWRMKLIGDEQMKFYRLGVRTEQRECGPDSSNQVDKLQSVLKDEAVKTGLQLRGQTLKIPPLNVVNYPELDPENPPLHSYRDGGFPAYMPGPLDQLSWTNPKNAMATLDYEHAKFASANGRDFNPMYRAKSPLSRAPFVTRSASDAQFPEWVYPPRKARHAKYITTSLNHVGKLRYVTRDPDQPAPQPCVAEADAVV